MSDEAGYMSMSAQDDDTDMGQALFMIFIAACLIVTGVIALLALINTWWLLAVAFVIHVGMTTVVSLAVFNAVEGRSRAIRLPHLGVRA